jgi:hypothetical protein
MNAAFFLPYAKTAAEVATATVVQVGKGLADAGASFAEMLAPEPSEDEQDQKNEVGAKDASDATAMLNLVDQIQNQLQATLQSMGLQLDGELNLSIDADGKVSVGGDSDSAAMLEQLINSDPALQAKMGALKRACAASGAADQLEAKLRTQAGKLQFQVIEPAMADEIIS